MTSQENADLVGSRHDNVMRTVDRLADRKVIQLPPTEEVKNSGGQTVRHFIFRGEQGKRDLIIVVPQLSPEFTAALVDRCQEPEAEVAKPQFQLPTLSMVLAAEQEEQRGVLTHQVEVQGPKIAEDSPKVEAYKQLVDSTANFNFKKPTEIS
jgi:phage regulator Rha-like protein